MQDLLERPARSTKRKAAKAKVAAKTDRRAVAVDAIRMLSADAVEKAGNGHPGTAVALAPVMERLWNGHLRYDPADPQWPDRDRFVLSIGHASMLLYSALHLAGVTDPDGRPAVTLDDIRGFRTLESRCAGHPEYGHVTGVEMTTGPLGQGVATSVGMAVAARWKGARYNRADHDLYSHSVYAVCGDGCMMEGVTAEAASLAGHLELSNLCWIYDSNKITIEGATDVAFIENVEDRFRAYGWAIERVADANDAKALDQAFEKFKGRKCAPTLVIVDSVIGYGAGAKAGHHHAHGEPLGEEAVAALRTTLDWPHAPFEVPDEAYAAFRDGVAARGQELGARWAETRRSYANSHPDLDREIAMMEDGGLPEGWADLPTFEAGEAVAGRAASGKTLNALAKTVPWLVGGSADLAPSTKTHMDGAGDQQAGEPAGRNMHYGVREHAMAACVNGMALSGLRAFGAGFAIFSDYMKPSIRLGALMGAPSVWVLTHDSLAVGEDGPTHQPIEQLVALRSIPGLVTIRPADANEVAQAWAVALESTDHPTALVLSRQNLPTFDRSVTGPAEGVRRGGYVLQQTREGDPDVILIGTGSEVSLCVEAAAQLAGEGRNVRVVSLPSWELFELQDRDYRDEVLPPHVKARVSVELGSPIGWERYAGCEGAILAMRSYGASGNTVALMERFGFTADAVADAARDRMAHA